MTTGPTDGTVTTAAGGPGGMPLALKLNEELGHMVPKRAERCAPRADAVPGMRGLC